MTRRKFFGFLAAVPFIKLAALTTKPEATGFHCGGLIEGSEVLVGQHSPETILPHCYAERLRRRGVFVQQSVYGETIPVVMGNPRSYGLCVNCNEEIALSPGANNEPYHTKTSSVLCSPLSKYHYAKATPGGDVLIFNDPRSYRVTADADGVRDENGNRAGYWKDEGTLVIYPQHYGADITVTTKKPFRQEFRSDEDTRSR